jgi:hypothetical protein
MRLHARDRAAAVQGRAGLWVYNERTGLLLPRCSRPNQIQDDWMFIAAKAIGMRLSNYGISAMYVEYENVADPDDPVAAPAFERDEGVEYYEDLAFSSNRDFLRVPLLQNPLLGIEAGYEELFVAGTSGNKPTFFSMSQGTTGVHGKAYSDAANSKVFGVALVATPVFADRTQDLIFSRTYFAAAEQWAKEASHQIGVTWDIAFLRPE